MPQMREDQFRILVYVDGVALPQKAWQFYEGGDIEAQNTNTRPGGMLPALELGGPTQRSDVTVRTLYSNDTLHPLLLPLENACGKKKFTVTWQPLDADGNPSGAIVVQTGILKSVTHPNYDANATNAATLQLVAGMNAESTLATA